MNLTDPVPVAQALIRCPSVTPQDAGAQEVVAGALEQLGFGVHRLRFGGIENLFARIGDRAPHFCFAGHTDVVPPGEGWHAGPFAAELRDGALYGRGACDMKGAIAAFVAAVARYLAGGELGGSISLLITGDEEGAAINGTVRVLEWMAAAGHIPDFCLVGEPTNPGLVGEVIKIGRRGSLNARITAYGVQGHSAYPHLADNPVHRLIRALGALIAGELDSGTEWFQASSLQVTSIDVGNPAANVIPASARAGFNIRFNDRHTGAGLESWLRSVLGQYMERFDLEVSVSGEPFLTAPGAEVEKLRSAIAAATGVAPRLDTGGGTSDARFIAKYCKVAEFGLVGATMHQADERVVLADLALLTETYRSVLTAFLG
ncbi:MAG: succinyl-diaminopimelate desuccinylase [Acetobacteraceae bacterium]|nr:succinyl-diaminopimelate desuccinylase [Acetobacteraceae bacterium]